MKRRSVVKVELHVDAHSIKYNNTLCPFQVSNLIAFYGTSVQIWLHRVGIKNKISTKRTGVLMPCTLHSRLLTAV